MAEEIVKVLNIETVAAINSVKALKEAINETRDYLVAMNTSMGDAAKETWEYQRAVDKLNGLQNTLNEVMGKSSKQTKIVASSYYDLNAQLVEARKRWKNLTEAERAEVAAQGEGDYWGQIQSLDKQLKEMDASIGQFQRNVGDYAGQIGSIAGLFGSAGQSATNAVGGVLKLKASFTALSANPLLGVLTALIAIVQKVISSFKSSEDTMNAVAVAFAPLKSAGDAFTKTLQTMAKGLATAVGWLTKVADKLGLVSKEMSERQALAKKEIELQKMERDALYENADLRLEIARLNAKSTDEATYSAQERIKFIEQANALEEQMSRQNVERAKKAWEIQKQKNALTESSTEDLRKEADLYAAMVNAETEYFTKTKELTSRRIAAVQQLSSVESARLTTEKEIIEQELALTKAGSEQNYQLRLKAREKQYQLDAASKKSSIKDKQALAEQLLLLERKYLADVRTLNETHEREMVENGKKHLTNRMNTYTQGSEEYLKRAVYLRQYEFDTLKQLDAEADEDFKARQLTAYKALVSAQQALYDYGLKQTRQAMTNEMSAMRAGSVDALAKAVEVARFDLENTYQKIGESDAEFGARMIANEQAVKAAEEALYSGRIETQRQALKNRMNEEAEGSAEYLSKAIELKKYELDTLHQLEGESNEQFRARQLAAEKEYANARKTLLNQQISIYTGYANVVADITSSVADIIENSTDGDERATQAVKNLRIANAIIDTLSGAVTAFSTAQQLGPIAGPITGSINAAAVIAAGMANVAKIRSTTVSTTSAASTSAASVSVATPTAVASIPTNIVTTTASDETKLNQMQSAQRVYILSSDLEANSKRVAIVQGESRF